MYTGLVIAKTGQSAVGLLSEVRRQPVTQQILSFWCHDVDLYTAGICMAAACSKRLTGLTGEVWPVWTMSVHCWGELYFTSACVSSLWEFRPLITLWLFTALICSLLSQNGKYFPAKPLFGFIKQINLDLTTTEHFFTLCCSHAVGLSDQTNMVLFFVFQHDRLSR